MKFYIIMIKLFRKYSSSAVINFENMTSNRKNYLIKKEFYFGNTNKFLSLIALLFVFNFFFFNSVSGQIGASQYSFSAQPGGYERINGTPITVSFADDGSSNGQQIGFNFTFGSNVYTQFNVSTNGWITLGTALTPNNIVATGVTNNFTAPAISPTIAPFWDDLAVSNLTGDISYLVTGTAPNRVLTVQYENMKWNYLATGSSIDFQIRLLETSNIIRFIYSPTSNTINNPSASIGIATSAASFLSLDGTGTLPNANAAVSTNNLTVQPAQGQNYIFTPPPPCSGTPTPGNTIASVISVCAGSGATTTLSIQNYAVNYAFQWQSSSSSTGPFNDIIGATGSTYVATPTATTYYICNVTCLTSGVSAPSAPVQVFYDQTCIIIPVSGTVNACSGNFFDAGGPTGNYSNNETRSITIFPSTPGASVQVRFNSFSTENNFDGLQIYNGRDNTTPLISSGLPAGTNATTAPAGSFYGSTSPGTVTSTSPDGALTFIFNSDGIIVSTGWNAVISCILPCDGTPAPGNTLASQTFVCSGGTTDLSMQTYFSGVMYQWETSTDNVNYSPIAGANASNYIATLTRDTWFRCKVKCISSGLEGISSPIIITSSRCEDIIMPSDDTRNTVVTCAGHFVDDGGVANNYAVNAIGTVTLVPATPGTKIRVVFNSFNTENNYDGMMIYNGNNSSAPLISSGLPAGFNATTAPAGSFYGTNSPGIITSTATDGSLTFVFKSDNIITRPGWEATVFCYNSDVCVGAPAPGNTLSTIDTVCYGGYTRLSLQNTTVGLGVTYQWQTSSGASGPWNPIPGAVAQSYTTSPLTATSYFNCLVTCSGISVASASKKIVVNESCIIMPPIGSVGTCNSRFFDSGDSTGNYGDNEHNVLAVSPTSNTQITSVTFNSFLLNPTDSLKIYNGIGTAAPLIGSYTTSPGTISSTDIPTGALTFEFISDGSLNAEGWKATINCLPKTICAGVENPGNTIASYDTVCLGGTTNLSLQNTLSLGQSYRWETSATGLTGSWLPITGAVNPNYIATITQSQTYFRCVVKCSAAVGSTDSTISSVILIMGVTQPILTTTTAITLCGSRSTVLTASATSGTIKWFTAQIGGTAVAIGSSFVTPIINTNTTYFVSSSNGDCESPRSEVILTVAPVPSPVVINPSDSAIICPTPNITEISVTGGLMPDGSQAPVTWSPVAYLYRDAAATIPYVAGSSTTVVYCKPPTSANNTVLTYIASAGTTCTIADTVNLLVRNLNPSVSIVHTPAGPQCDSTTIIFTATPVNGSSPAFSPAYQWFVNGISVTTGYVAGLNVIRFPDALLSTPYLRNGDIVKCVMLPHPSIVLCNQTFATSNSDTLVFLPNVKDSVSLSSSNNPICLGWPVTFTATPILNGGVNPRFQFFVNGIAQTSISTTNTYTTSSITNGQIITVKMYSGLQCTSPNPATSNAIVATIANINTPIFTQVPSVCIGGTYTLPIVSNNGITGTWSPALNNSVTTTYTFTPTQGLCANTTTMTVSVNSSTLPTFNQIQPVCSGTSYTLPASSLEGITGTWTPAINNSSTTLYTFRPDSGQCARVTSMLVEVYQNPTASIVPVGALCTSVPVNLSSGASSPAGILSYQWLSSTSGLAGTFGNINGAIASNYFADTFKYYMIQVVDSNQCRATSSVYQLATITSGPMSGTYTIGAIKANNVSSSGTTITVNGNSNGLEIGAVLTKTGGTSSGVILPNTIITSINGNVITVNKAPNPPLSGDTISGTTCTNFISIKRAVDSLNRRTINGSCIFNVTPGHIENLSSRISLGNTVLNPTVGNNTITFRKFGSGSNPLIKAFTGTKLPTDNEPDGIWSLDGIDRVTIDGIDLFDGNTVSPTTMMEYGFGLFKTGATDGAQRDTIKNCVISLNKDNNASGASNPILNGSVGIAMMNSVSTLATTSITTTSTSGSNSRNSFYSNTIQNCNVGVGLSGFAAVSPSFNLGDTLNDIGGNSISTGNSITNFGGGGTNEASGIRAKNQWGINISFSTIINNTNHNGIIRGIYGESGSGANININNNIVSINTISTNASAAGIDNNIGNNGTNNTVNINNNTVTVNNSLATSGNLYAINQNAIATNLNMNGNIVQNSTLSGSGEWRAIYNGAASTNIIINNNIVQNNNIVCTNAGAASTDPFAFIYSKNASNAIKINGNNILNNKKNAAPATASYIYGIHYANSTTSSTSEISNNNIISDTVVSNATNPGSTTVDLAVINIGTSLITANNNLINNVGVLVNAPSNSKITLTGIRSINGSLSEIFNTNTIRRLYISGSSTSSVNVGNDINGIFSNSGSGVKNINNNLIDSLYAKSDFSTNIYGIRNSSGTTVNVIKNKIHSFFPGYTSGNLGVLASGIKISSLSAGTAGNSSNANINNNMVALDLTAAFSPASAAVINNQDGLRGIDFANFTTTFTNLNVYYNSIRLAGTGSVSFGSSGLYHTSNATATSGILDLRNNNVVNECTPVGSSTVAAFKRSTNTNALLNFASSSNNNNLYVIPGDNKCIYTDGTTSITAIGSYRTLVSTRDANSISVLPVFASNTDLHLLDRTGNNAFLDSGASAITSITNDIDNENRDATKPDIGADEFSAISFAGRVIYDTSICSGSSIIMTLINYSGSISGWEYSNDATNWNTIASTTSSYNFVNQTQTFYVRALVNGTPSTYARVTVKPLPEISLSVGGGAISSASVCAGASLQLNGTSTAATVNPWVTSSSSIASVNNNGLISAINVGSTQVTYTYANGCSKTITLTVNPVPVISGNRSICVGSTTTLSATGTAAISNPWVTAVPSIASINSSGIATGVVAGKTLVTFTNIQGCSITDSITVYANPIITGGANPFCQGSSVSLIGSNFAATSNAWSSTNTSVVTISQTGFINAISVGTSSIKYTNINGCFKDTIITVSVLPSVTGPSFACMGSTVQLTGSPTPATINPWTSINTTVATVNSNGLVTAVDEGFCQIAYKNSVGCSKIVIFTVYTMPDLYNVTGGGTYCTGSNPATIGLSGSQLGISYQLMLLRSPSDSMIGLPIIGTGAALNFGSPTVSGTYYITATNTITTCSRSMVGTKVITINPLPQGSISTTSTTCTPGPGFLTFTATSGTGPFTIVYNDGIANRLISNVRSGVPFATFITPVINSTTYALISVTDSNGCVRSSGFIEDTVTINRSTYRSFTYIVCDTMTWNGTLYSTSGNYTYNYFNTSGCPSTDTLHLTVNYTTNIAETATQCEYYYWARHNESYTSSGSYTFAYINSNGCPSVDTLYLTIYYGTHNSLTDTGCLSYTWNGNTYSSGGTYTYSYLNANNCPSVDTLHLTINNYNSWLGTINSDWNNANNWCGGVPTNSSNVVISGGRINYPSINVATSPNAVCKKITLRNGASLNVLYGGKITIYDTITVNSGGIFNARNGTVELAGSVTQPISSNVFQGNNLRNLIINNANVVLAGPLNILGKLSFAGSNRLFATNNNLTLKSSDSLTASVGNVFKDENTGLLISGNQITGDVTVERYLSSRKAWRLLSSPTRHNLQTIKQAWMEGQGSNTNLISGYGIQITSNRASWLNDGFDMQTPPGPSVKTMDFSSTLWNGITSTLAPFQFGKSYMTFVRGDRSVISYLQPPTSTIIREKGRLYIGDSTLSLGSSPASGRYVSVGNIYASAISLSNMNRVNLDSSYYLWDPQLAGIYGFGAYQTVSVNNGIVSIAPGGGSYATGNVNVESGQGFLVRSINAGASSISFKENNKTDGSYLVSRMSNSISSFRTNMFKLEGGLSSLYDGVLNVYDDSYHNDVEPNDAIKLFGSSESLSLKENDQFLAIDRKKFITDSDTIFYELGQMRNSTYKFEFTPDNMNSAGLSAYLEDLYLRTRTPISLDVASSVNFEVNSDSASYSSDRFRIVFKMALTLPVTFVDISAEKLEKDVKVKWKVANELNMNRYVVERSLDGTHFNSIGEKRAINASVYDWLDNQVYNGNNFYRIRGEEIGGSFKYSKVVKVSFEVKPQITFYPNPLKDDRLIHIKMQNKSEGNYHVKVINALGQIIITKELYHKGGNNEYTLRLNASLMHGLYLIELRDMFDAKTISNFIY